MSKNRLLIMLMGAALGTSMLSGCAPLLIGGAVGTTALVTTDRRTTSAQMADEVLETRVKYDVSKAIASDMHLTVTSYNRRVLLTGEVATQADKQKATRIAQRSLEVVRVVNELKVMPVSDVPQRLSDSLLASKVRAQLIGTNGVSLNQMKVIVERSVVYLMGVVTPSESKLAADIVARVAGVKSVVKVFEEMSEEQIRERMKYLEGSDRSVVASTVSDQNENDATEVRLQ
ncbi:MAG: BON domain-containing protein [Burkholderiaceae bacterium]|nr:BON domain-containing protein [Burkholderiaceae bacterium]